MKVTRLATVAMTLAGALCGCVPDETTHLNESEATIMLTEIAGQEDGGLPALQVTGSFRLDGLNYPVRVVTKDSKGNVVASRMIADEGAAIEDNVLLAAEMRADIAGTSDPEVRAKAIKFLRGILHHEDTDAYDREFHIAVLRGLGDEVTR